MSLMKRVALLLLPAALAVAAAFLVNGCSTGDRLVERRLLLVGIDGMDWGVAQRLSSEGRIPNLTALAASGVSCPLRTLEPLEKSPVIWTTIATGKLPQKHGIGDLMAADGKRILTSNVRTARTFWDVLGSRGETVTVIGWLVSWPAEPVNGVMVTDYFSFVPRDGRTFPEDLTYPAAMTAELDSLRAVAEDVTDGEIARFACTDAAYTAEEAARLPMKDRFAEMRAKAELPVNVRALRDFLAGDRTYLAVALHLLRTSPTDAFIVYFRGLDWTCHRFWAAAHPSDCGFPISTTESRVFGETVERYYEHADAMLGTLVEAYGDGATIIVCSDHGFRGPGPGRRPGGISDHAPLGVFYMSGEGIRVGETLPERSVRDVTPTILALYGLPVGEDMDGSPIVEGFTEEFLEKHPIRKTPSYEGEETQ